MSRNTRSRAQSANAAGRRGNLHPGQRSLRFESLEDRRLLSTITWSNRGSGPGDNSDGFVTLFAGNAGLARQIVDRAIDDWEAVIQNFNYSGGGNTFNLQVTPANITAIASSGITNITNGKPTSATISLRNVATTHWLDPTPADDAEFVNNITNVFTAFASGISGTDLYATMIHEIGHAVGISQEFSTLSIASLITDTGVDDPNSTAAGNLLAFNVGGGPIEATFTASDFGHVWEGPATAETIAAGLPVHADDLMNSGRSILGSERNLISDLDATILQLAYGYTVAMPSTINNMLVNTNYITKVMSVLGGLNNADDTIWIAEAPGEMVRVTIGNLQELVPLPQVFSIAVNSGGGDDHVRFSPLIPPLFPTPVITANLGVGANTLEIVGATNGYDSITLNGSTLTSTGVNITAFSGAQALTLYTDGGNADIYMPNTPVALTSATIYGGFGGETINLYSLDAQTPVIINALGGDDTITVGASPFASEVIKSPVTVFGEDGNDTLMLGSNNADSVDANITFNGGTSSSFLGDRIIFNDQAPSYNVTYDVTPTSVTRDGFNLPHTVSYSNTDGIVINAGSGADTVTVRNAVTATVTANGNDGNDNFIVGGGNLTGAQPQIFNGGNGNDQITFDDHLDLTNRIWDIRPNEVIFGGLISLFTTGFESVGVLAGDGADEITFAGNFAQNLNIDGGGGVDRFLWNEAKNFYPLSGTYSVNLNGGDGINRLEITQAAQGALTFNVTGTRIYALGDPFDIFTGKPDINYANFIAVLITAGPQADRFNVYDTNPSSNYTINGGDGADYFYMQTNPATRNNVALNGQAGNDTLAIDDSVFANENVPYTFKAASGILLDRVVRDTGPLTITIYGYTSMASLIVSGTTGNDTFNVDEYKSGAPLVIHGGDGDDTLNFGGGNLPANITNIAAFTFNGQAGIDRFNLNNTVDFSQWQYIRDTGTIRVDRLGPFFGYTAILYETSIEEMTLNASSGVDAFYVRAVTAGASIIVNAGGGLDGLVVADSTQNLQAIQGPIRYNAGAGGGNVLVSDNADTTGDTGHLTDTTLGAIPGDNLFGPGGWLEFHNLVDFGSFPGITLNLSSGADTIYAQPLASARVTINAGNATAAPGDTLNLELATAANYAVNGTPANGNVTSTNLKTLSYTGFETGPFITTSPDLLGDFGRDGVVDAADYVMWRKMLGMSVAQAFGGADGSGNYMIGPEDHAVWRANFGKILPPPGVGSATDRASSIVSQDLQADAASERRIPADQVGEFVVLIRAETISASAKTNAAAARAASFTLLETRPLGHDSSSRSRRTIHRYQVAASDGGDLFQLLAIDRVWRSPRQDSFVNDDSGIREHRADDYFSESVVNEPLAVALAAWQGARSSCTLPG
jgi:hypothetical protein